MLLIIVGVRQPIIFRLSVWSVMSFRAESGVLELHSSLTPVSGLTCMASQGYYGAVGDLVQAITPLALVRFTLTGCCWKGAGLAAYWREWSSAISCERTYS